MGQPHGQRNVHGVKDSADLFRTVGGERFDQYMSDPTPLHLEAYKGAGIKFRKVKLWDGSVELFMHKRDWDAAGRIDAELYPRLYPGHAAKSEQTDQGDAK